MLRSALHCSLHLTRIDLSIFSFHPLRISHALAGMGSRCLQPFDLHHKPKHRHTRIAVQSSRCSVCAEKRQLRLQHHTALRARPWWQPADLRIHRSDVFRPARRRRREGLLEGRIGPTGPTPRSRVAAESLAGSAGRSSCHPCCASCPSWTCIYSSARSWASAPFPLRRARHASS